MMTIKEYRAAILKAMLEKKDERGNAVIEEKEAEELLDSFSDDELQDGILWNTPEDVAEMLLED